MVYDKNEHTKTNKTHGYLVGATHLVAEVLGAVVGCVALFLAREFGAAITVQLDGITLTKRLTGLCVS